MKRKKEKIVSVPLYTLSGKKVGTLRGLCFKKSVRSSIHLFKSIGQNGSWGIDYEILFKQLPEACSIEITDEEKHILYMVPAAEFRQKGVIKHFKQGTLDHYTQVFLPVEGFDRVNLNGNV